MSPVERRPARSQTARGPVRVRRRKADEVTRIDEETADAVANLVRKLERLAAAKRALEVLQATSGNWFASGDQVFVMVTEAALEALVAAIYGEAGE